MWVNYHWLLLGNHTRYPELLSGSSAEKRHTKTKNGCRRTEADALPAIMFGVLVNTKSAAAKSFRWTFRQVPRERRGTEQSLAVLRLTKLALHRTFWVALLLLCLPSCHPCLAMHKTSYLCHGELRKMPRFWPDLTDSRGGILTVPNRLKSQVTVSNMLWIQK